MFSKTQPFSGPSILALLPAAGVSRRMGDPKRPKLLAELEGEPLLRRAARQALASQCQEVIVITGHLAKEHEKALQGLPLHIHHNESFANGMGSSLALGAKAAKDFDAMLVLLPDMPLISKKHIDALIAAFDGKRVLRASHQGKAGNPVLLPRALFAALERLEGDIGAREVIAQSGLEVAMIEIGPAALLDLDTPEAMAAHGVTPILLP